MHVPFFLLLLLLVILATKLVLLVCDHGYSCTCWWLGLIVMPFGVWLGRGRYSKKTYADDMEEKQSLFQQTMAQVNSSSPRSTSALAPATHKTASVPALASFSSPATALPPPESPPPLSTPAALAPAPAAPPPSAPPPSAPPPSAPSPLASSSSFVPHPSVAAPHPVTPEKRPRKSHRSRKKNPAAAASSKKAAMPLTSVPLTPPSRESSIMKKTSSSSSPLTVVPPPPGSSTTSQKPAVRGKQHSPCQSLPVRAAAAVPRPSARATEPPSAPTKAAGRSIASHHHVPSSASIPPPQLPAPVQSPIPAPASSPHQQWYSPFRTGLQIEIPSRSSLADPYTTTNDYRLFPSPVTVAPPHPSYHASSSLSIHPPHQSLPMTRPRSSSASSATSSLSSTSSMPSRSPSSTLTYPPSPPSPAPHAIAPPVPKSWYPWQTPTQPRSFSLFNHSYEKQ
ncbi:hypothetical protein DM01DRAFT_1407766 [Hesseltinella vesiculosa]|uniref:Uncharacterized protein n=1 Tax=Hesseltinella vesiculosa TaxID=101127 RepID=A0A1X2GH88_9FUNG|nr:hypothetical protein DM01DRAFT_1407766 [Hesseltinella vesiculosa]